MLSCSPVYVAALVVDCGKWCVLAAGSLHFVLCYLGLSGGLVYGDMRTVHATVAEFALSPYLTDSCSPSGALPEESFLSPRWLTALSCRGLGGDGDAGSLLAGVLSPELDAGVQQYRQRHCCYTMSAPQPPQPPRKNQNARNKTQNNNTHKG